MSFLYNFFGNYGIAIILFTFISKIILLPISIWVQKNSIKMVKMQPFINQIKIKFYGDKDRIAEEESKLYKKEKYNAFASIIPLIVQVILLLGLVEVINHPMTYIMHMDNTITSKFISSTISSNPNLDPSSSSLEIQVVKNIKNEKYTSEYQKIKDDIGDEQYNNCINEIKNLDLNFLGFDMSLIANIEGGIAWLIPLIAGLSALFLCVMQNKMNVLQAEQSKFNQIGMLVLSVGLSLYLGIFVSAGIALYWTASNLLAVLQQWLLNIYINPKDYVDYEMLKKSQEELQELNSINNKKKKRTKKQIKKERNDYKKFFSVVNKHLVFYSESNGFYKYYKGIIEYILNNTNITIHYITSDYNDEIFNLEKKYKNLAAYYIEEKKLITLMMKLDTDVMVMTMPDLENFHIKRSYVRKDIEYIYLPHGMDSMNLTMRKCSTNNYDTILSTGKYQTEEMEKINEYYHLDNRKIVKCGCSLLDDMQKNYKEAKKTKSDIKTVLIAPSWQKDNIIDLCLENILDSLKNEKYKIIVRPHPQQVRHMPDYFESLKDKYKENDKIIIQTDFSSNETVFNSDLLITDWSAIAYEFAFTTDKPVLFVDTPMKIMNPEYKNIKVEPFNIWSRKRIGNIIPLKDVNKTNKYINEMFTNQEKYCKMIKELLKESVYNIGKSDEVGAEYIIKSIQEKIKERKIQNEKKNS